MIFFSLQSIGQKKEEKKRKKEEEEKEEKKKRDTWKAVTGLWPKDLDMLSLKHITN